MWSHKGGTGPWQRTSPDPCDIPAVSNPIQYIVLLGDVLSLTEHIWWFWPTHQSSWSRRIESGQRYGPIYACLLSRDRTSSGWAALMTKPVMEHSQTHANIIAVLSQDSKISLAGKCVWGGRPNILGRLQQHQNGQQWKQTWNVSSVVPFNFENRW